MKKVTMMVLGLLMAASLLSGCYSTQCGHDEPMSKDSAPAAKAK